MLIKGQNPATSSSATRSATTGYRARRSTTCWPTRRSASSGRRSSRTSRTRSEALGYAGRFGAGLPRINDGSFLFLQHMISKMEPVEDKGCPAGDRLQRLPAVHRRGRLRRVGDPPVDPGERLAGRRSSRCLTNSSTTPGSPRTSGSCPTARPAALEGKVILLDARDQWEKMRKSLGDKRKQISDDQIDHITQLYGDALAAAADPQHPDHGRGQGLRRETSDTSGSPSNGR